MAVVLIAMASGLFGSAEPATAQTSGSAPAPATESTQQQPHQLLRPGNIVVTGFSGTRVSDPSIDRSKADADAVAIDTNGASLRVLDVSGVGKAGSNPTTDASEIAAYSARTIGQVFGVALDDAIDPVSKVAAPNIYATASSAYGLNIVLPPIDDNGWPRRTLGGDQSATWMDGQWGQGDAGNGDTAAHGQGSGGPGSVWRIDGVTGRVSLFATIATNGRPTGAASLGNIAYDATSHQFFVSDLESGLIHRLSLTGQDLGTFDHGVTARTAAKLPPVPDDPAARADIKSMHFRADDPNSWGFAQPSRRVWGLNVSAGRLYYAVADGPEVWSVAILPNGDLGDARREIVLPADDGPFEITDINFDSKGWIYLAQRPPVTGNYDYRFITAEAPAKLMRYRPDPATNSWAELPEEYAVGLTGNRRQTDGGVALGYGYESDGKIDYGTCDATLWATGDDLDRRPLKTANAGKSDAPDGSAGLNISGLQGSPLDPTALTPAALRFVDYDGILPVAPTRGQIGDVRVVKNCGSPAAAATGTIVEPEPANEPIDLEIEKIARGPCRIDRICHVEIRIWNRGGRRYFGPLTIADTLEKAGATLVETGPSRWQCGQGGQDISCHHPALDIGPGFSTSVFLDYRLPRGWPYPEFADCVDVTWLGDLEAPETIGAVEIELARLGFFAGEADRRVGPKLQAAIEAYSTAHGLSPERAITRDLIERLFGAGSAISRDRIRSHGRACAGFHVEITGGGLAYTPPPPVIFIPQPPILLPPPIIITTCPPGFWSRNGECVRACPWGYRAFGDRCLPEGGPVCRNGWFERGQCACPDGYAVTREANATVCSPPQGNGPQRCLGGLFDGRHCLCPTGTSQRDGRCEPNQAGSNPRPRVTCPPGFLINGGACVSPGRVNPPVVAHPPIVARTCGPNEVLVGGACQTRHIETTGRGSHGAGRTPLHDNPIRTDSPVRTGGHPHNDRIIRVDRTVRTNGPGRQQVIPGPRTQHPTPAQPNTGCRIVNGKCVR